MKRKSSFKKFETKMLLSRKSKAYWDRRSNSRKNSKGNTQSPSRSSIKLRPKTAKSTLMKQVSSVNPDEWQESTLDMSQKLKRSNDKGRSRNQESTSGQLTQSITLNDQVLLTLQNATKPLQIYKRNPNILNLQCTNSALFQTRIKEPFRPKTAF